MERIGRSNCYRLFLTGERFDDVVARDIGLLHERTETVEQLDAVVDNLAAQVVENSPAAVGRCKELIQRVARLDYSGMHTPVR